VRLVLDAGAFLAVERGQRETIALIKKWLVDRTAPITHGGVVAQIWRGGSGRQAPVARLLRGTRVEPLDDALGRRTGMLLAGSHTSDAIDAAVVLLAADGDVILTSDASDLAVLAARADLHVDIVQV
jgi:hypothetical protein